MKLIDILNKIANGELKEGTKFVYRGNMYIWKANMILNTTNTDAFDIVDRSDLNMELELIEPQEPKECEHEWREWSLGNRFQVTHCRKCDKCGLEEETEYNHSPDVGEMAECEHEWENYAMYNPNTGESRDYRKCAKCDLEEDIEPTDNTTEKIYELKDWYELPDGLTSEEKIQIIWNKLNEVIREINEEG